MTEFLLNNKHNFSPYLTETHYVFATETNRLILLSEIIAVYWENHTEHIDTLWAECRVLVWALKG
jgi:hypothetical protein